MQLDGGDEVAVVVGDDVAKGATVGEDGGA